MKKSFICISKKEIEDIDFYLRVSEYDDKKFTENFKIKIQKKNNIKVSSEVVSRISKKQYSFINYIPIEKIEPQLLLQILVDMYKSTIEKIPNKEKQEIFNEIDKIESFLERCDKNSFSNINYMDKNDFLTLPSRILGIIENSFLYEENVVLNASRGHGFAAEKANHLWDKISGKNATIIGGDNAKNGADRLVNDVYIQTKYCKRGGACISQCFDNGSFRYMGPDGKPMQIEVPSDKYESAVQAMEDRISKGQVPGVSDPKEARNIVRKGNITYTQARNIAKFGTIESLTYDAVNGIKLAGTTAGLSAVVAFSHSLWSGNDWQLALKKSCYTGLKVGGTAWASSVISSQVGRTGVEHGLRGASDWIVRTIGYKASAIISNAIRSGSNIHGTAAAKYLSKVLRGNIVTGIVTTTVISSADFYRLFKGNISGAQALKNVTVTATSVAGGTGGWLAGAAAGAAAGSAVPLIGTAAGGIVGGLLGSLGGGWAASKATKSTMDLIIADDANEMLEIIQKEFSIVAEDYLLSEKEASDIIERIKLKINNKLLMSMYASKEHHTFAYEWIENLAQETVKNRVVISNLPSKEEIIKETENIILDEISNSNESNIVNISYDGSAVKNTFSDQVENDLTGLIIPSNYRCPIYESEDLKMYVPFDCMVIKHERNKDPENSSFLITAIKI